VRIALGDFRNGYPAGSYPIATINLKALKAGSTPLTVTITPLTVTIDHVRYWSSDLSTFTDITSSATAVSGLFSTGALPATTQVIVSPVGTISTITTQYIPSSGPVSFGDSSSSGSGDVYTGVGGEPTLKTIPTTVATTVPTAVPTTVNTTVNITQTISEPTLTLETTAPTTVQTIAIAVPTTKKAGADVGLITLIGLAAAGLLLMAGRKN